jgi:hypothetical protein
LYPDRGIRGYWGFSSAAVAASFNNHMHSDSKKRRGFRYATATPLFAAGDVKRWEYISKKVVKDLG